MSHKPVISVLDRAVVPSEGSAGEELFPSSFKWLGKIQFLKAYWIERVSVFGGVAIGRSHPQFLPHESHQYCYSHQIQQEKESASKTEIAILCRLTMETTYYWLASNSLASPYSKDEDCTSKQVGVFGHHGKPTWPSKNPKYFNKNIRNWEKVKSWHFLNEWDLI